MKLSDYTSHDATGLAQLVRKGEVSAAELAEAALAAVELVNPRLNAVVETFPNAAKELRSSPPAPGLLAGVPILNKDLIADAGSLLEMGSELARGFTATYTDALLARLKKHGATVIGRTTTPEFGMATVTESRIAGVTRNPWDLGRTPAGSSGGSAAMVAARAVPLATGSDAGGSIRSPSAHCGVVGLKPSRGRISQMPFRVDPLLGLSTNFVVTRTVRDCALALQLCSGRAAGDLYGIEALPGGLAESAQSPSRLARALRVAYMETDWTGVSADADMLKGLEKTARVLEQHGHVLEEARPEIDHEPFAAALLEVWSANLACAIDDLSERVGRKPNAATLQSSILSYYQHGQQISATALLSAIAVIDGVNRAIGHFFEEYDLLITPTCLTPAPLVGALDCDPQPAPDVGAWDRQMNRIDNFLAVFNASGNPAISLPVHDTRSGLPVGIQLVAPFAGEAGLLRVAALLEAELPWEHRLPMCSVLTDGKLNTTFSDGHMPGGKQS